MFTLKQKVTSPFEKYTKLLGRFDTLGEAKARMHVLACRYLLDHETFVVSAFIGCAISSFTLSDSTFTEFEIKCI